MAVLVAVCWVMSLDLSAYGQAPKPIQAQPVLPSRLPVAAAGDLMAFSSETSSGPLLTVIDAKTRAMCVYHIDRQTGAIEFKGARSFHWDLLIEEFNGVSPLPREIRALMEQK